MLEWPVSQNLDLSLASFDCPHIAARIFHYVLQPQPDGKCTVTANALHAGQILHGQLCNASIAARQPAT